jgi:hypothetical protein
MKSAVITALLTLFLLTNTAFAADPLPSWNAGAAKRSTIEFVTKVTTAGSPDFVPDAERIAVFDNDGTLWCEQPVPVQLYFALDRVSALAPQHPEWKTKEPFASLLKGDLKTALAGGEKAILELFMATHTGMTTVEFERIVKDWIATAKHPKTGSTPKWSISRCWNCSHICARTVSRTSSSPAASNSCARGRKKSMAFRRSRS